MHEFELPFIGLRYSFDCGPASLKEDIGSLVGINCQGLTHAFYNNIFGIRLPVDALSK